MEVPQIRIVLDNGTAVQAELQLWLMALIASLPKEQAEAVCRRVDQMQAEALARQVTARPGLVSV